MTFELDVWELKKGKRKLSVALLRQLPDVDGFSKVPWQEHLGYAVHVERAKGVEYFNYYLIGYWDSRKIIHKKLIAYSEHQRSAWELFTKRVSNGDKLPQRMM